MLSDHLRRACLGRNVALLSLTTFTAMIAYRYDITLECPEQSVSPYKTEVALYP